MYKERKEVRRGKKINSYSAVQAVTIIHKYDKRSLSLLSFLSVCPDSLVLSNGLEVRMLHGFFRCKSLLVVVLEKCFKQVNGLLNSKGFVFGLHKVGPGFGSMGA